MTTVLPHLLSSTALPTRVNNEQAAAVIGVTPKTLRFWRHKGRGPRYIKFGPEQHAGVAYDLADIEAWLEERKFSSTSAVSAAARAATRAAARAGAPKPNPASAARIVAPWQATV